MISSTEYWSQKARQAITDEEAFTELYEYYFPRVYQYLLGKTKDSSLADEFVSKTFLNMYQHLRDYDPDRGAFSTWLFRIAQNVVNKYYGSKAYTAHTAWDEDFDPADPQQATPEQQYVDKEQDEELKAAIMQLPERDQKILEMTYWLNMKSNEIGEALGMAPSSVRVALKQARERLKVLLEK
ncbi:RNA polymerase, sigma-24 subunit, ECF subfamily [Anaerovibrio sp. JC8]|uniref:RNA polymerase sigma factor n=1 Tax=Anaerovibrio sp. JC8 TaxID=1240085 RepID=UPI000A0C9360|nr:sigma-70 family RNA polymerase sigma factor [Anaerovibrio sp. JC8]ORT99732.1 RNA polymerase, sigma-24 subunit, ECF subfamily [Anaerovibrio sp. JC8]